MFSHEEEGRKYSGSRIGGEAAVFGECAAISLIPAGTGASLGTRGDHRRRSDRRMCGRKGSRRQAKAALTLGSVRGIHGLTSRRYGWLGELAQLRRKQGGVDGTRTC